MESQKPYKTKTVLGDYWTQYLRDGPTSEQEKQGFKKIDGENLLTVQQNMFVYQSIITMNRLAKQISDFRVILFLADQGTDYQTQKPFELEERKINVMKISTANLEATNGKYKLLVDFFFKFMEVPPPDFQNEVQDEYSDPVTELFLPPYRVWKEDQEKKHPEYKVGPEDFDHN